jgi:heat-inducible transcriptional repressor
MPYVSLSCSAIRKELHKLEEYGFIYKANASSGRVPTDKGLRYYFKKLVKNLESDNENSNLLLTDDLDFNNVSDNFLSHLSRETENIGFIFLNSIFDLNFRKIRMIKTGPHRIMTIIQSTNGWNFSKVFRTAENYSEKDLKKWESILTKEFRGRSLKSAFKSIRNRLYKEKEKYKKIYRGIYYLLDNEELMTAELLIKGSLNLLDSNLVDPDKVKRLLKTLEEKEKLSTFLNDILHNKENINGPAVIFGTETGISEFEDFLLIYSNFYLSKNPIGNIGVIGAKFVPDANIISRLAFFSTYFSKNFSAKTIIPGSPMEV